MARKNAASGGRQGLTPAGRPAPARFVTGSIPRHILVMTGTASVGLMAIFLADLLDMFLLSLLGDVAVTAAVGYAGPVLFLTSSICIGLSVATAAVVAPAVGAGRLVMARRLTVNAHLLTLATSAGLAALVWIAVPALLAQMGAGGHTHALAVRYLRMSIPAVPLMAIGMCSAAVLRALGDARRSMNTTLAVAAVVAATEPTLILVLGLGLDGAAIASILARAAMAGVGLFSVHSVHRMLARPKSHLLRQDSGAFNRVALPAVLANIATPVANTYVTSAIAPYGDEAVAGWAVIGRLIPVAFGAVFALTSAVGPIMGQNLGARDLGRVRSTLTTSLGVTAAFTLAAWYALAVAADPIVAAFHTTGESARLIRLFCLWMAPLFFFLGALFVANAAFNSLGHAHYSTLSNWGRATFGTVPFVWLCGKTWGAAGVLVGNMLGAIVFGAGAVWACYRLIDRIDPARRAAVARRN